MVVDFENLPEHSEEAYLYRQSMESLLLIHSSNKRRLELDEWDLYASPCGMTEEESAKRKEEARAGARHLCEVVAAALKQKYDVNV